MTPLPIRVSSCILSIPSLSCALASHALSCLGLSLLLTAALSHPASQCSHMHPRALPVSPSGLSTLSHAPTHPPCHTHLVPRPLMPSRASAARAFLWPLSCTWPLDTPPCTHMPSLSHPLLCPGFSCPLVPPPAPGLSCSLMPWPLDALPRALTPSLLCPDSRALPLCSVVPIPSCPGLSYPFSCAPASHARSLHLASQQDNDIM